MTTMEACLDAVCEVFGCDKEALRSRRRAAVLVRPRQLAMLVMAQKTPRSYPEIGRYLQRYHSTVMHGEQTARERLEWDEDYKAQYELVLVLLEARHG